MKKTVSWLALSVLVVACQKEVSFDQNEIKKVEWLIGNWETQTEFGVLSESWKKINDSTFSGKSHFINNTKDTVHHESIVLSEKNEKLMYQTIIKGENDDEPISFPLVSLTENTLVFENKNNEYPQKITYIKKSPTSIVALISGKQQGKESSEEFTLIKK
ncbi:DUF6265 family protein [Flavobacterium sp. TMP13]|uniref:DUF6265 family protein n=1 Tax=Flavobacterium sp. TMP13 TaxID=3425950 RepID=UPI003D7734F4